MLVERETRAACLALDEDPENGSWKPDRTYLPLRYQLWTVLTMLEKYAHFFYSIGLTLQDVNRQVAASRLKPTEPVNEVGKKHIHESAIAIVRTCEAVGLVLSAKTAKRLEALGDDEYTVGTLKPIVEDLTSRLWDELELIKFKLVTPNQAEYYDTPSLFGAAVATKFPKASYDIDEAGKCLALDRGTACVMHLMRVIEVAVAAVAQGVGLPATAVENIKAWEHLLREIKRLMQANNTSKVPAWIASQGFFEDALAYFYAVKDAWRNPTMHIEKKYTPEEAERIYVAVKNLMVRLAEHLDESGVFTA